MPEPTIGRRELSRWLVAVTRPVLAPLGASTVFRLLDQLTGLALFAIGMIGVLRFATGGWESLWSLALVLIALSLVKAVMRYVEQFLGHLVAFRALELLRREVFAKLWPQAPAVLSRSRSGDLLERATKDIDRLEVFFAHTFAPAVSAVLSPLIAVLVTGFVVSWPVALVMGLGLVVTLVAVPVFGARTSRDAAIRTSELRGRMTHSITDSVQGLTEVTGYGLEERRLHEADSLAHELEETGRRLARVSLIRRSISLVTMFLTAIGIVLVGAGTEPALLAATVVVALRSFDITKAVEDFLSDLDASFASATRLWTLTHTPPTVSDPASPESLPEGPLDVSWLGVTFTYQSEDGNDREPALKHVTAHAATGQHTCLVGVSGSGKSTLSQLALRYADPSEGSVQLGGVDVRDLPLAALREAVTYVSQRPFLFNDTVRGNLRLARPEATNEEILDACRLAHIHEHVMSLPKGYDTPVGELAGRWSGGQRARLALARALITRARVFILDEYTSSLDGALADQVAQSLRQARPDATIIEITHRVSSSLTADHVIVLDGGAVAESGRPAELQHSGGHLTSLLERETDHVRS